LDSTVEAFEAVPTLDSLLMVVFEICCFAREIIFDTTNLF
jgi:hypothetical protein